MKNVIYILVIVACVGTIIFGILQVNQKENEASKNPSATKTPLATASKTSTVPAAVTMPTNIPDSASIVTSTKISAGTTHFRPDQPAVSATADPVDAERNFIITPEIIAKKYLVDKYKMGICFKTPIVVPQIAITGLVSKDPPFSDFLRQAYSLKTDLEVYNKIKQFQTITLTETASSVYKYSFSDGQCSTVVYQEGVVTVSEKTATDTVTMQESHTY